MSKFSEKVERLKKSILGRLEERDIVSVDIASKGNVFVGLLGFRQDDRKVVVIYVRGQNIKRRLYINLEEVENYIRMFEFLKKHKEELEKIVGKPPRGGSAPDIDELEKSEEEEETEEKPEKEQKKKKKEETEEEMEDEL
jgi:predicted ribosome quality control (RQC) complex YloA/Tae2 family protein